MMSAVSAKDLLDRVKALDISNAEIKESAEITASLSKHGLKDWRIFGQPGPEWAIGKFHVQPDQLGELVSSVAKLKNPFIDLEIFPLGIKWPDMYEVQMKFGSRRG